MGKINEATAMSYTPITNPDLFDAATNKEKADTLLVITDQKTLAAETYRDPVVVTCEKTVKCSDGEGGITERNIEYIDYIIYETTDESVPIKKIKKTYVYRELLHTDNPDCCTGWAVCGFTYEVVE